MLDQFESKNESGKNDQDNASKQDEIPNENKTEETGAPEDKKDAPVESKSVDNENPEPPEWEEKFFRVRFQAKSHPNDTIDVPLGVNGEIINVKREEEVVIPERYVEVAQHAEYPHFTQMPGEKRKIVSKVRLYPFEIIGEATEKEYLTMKAEGTKKLLEEQAQGN